MTKLALLVEMVIIQLHFIACGIRVAIREAR